MRCNSCGRYFVANRPHQLIALRGAPTGRVPLGIESDTRNRSLSESRPHTERGFHEERPVADPGPVVENDRVLRLGVVILHRNVLTLWHMLMVGTAD